MYISHSKPYIQPAFVKETTNIISEGMLARGERVDQFSNELSNYLHNKYVFLTPSGTAAIYLSLRAIGLEKDDEVILPTYVCYSVAEAILLAGGKPVFCDIGNSWVMEVQNVQPLITRKTKAIIVVHIFGILADIRAFKNLNIPIVEDCCQCFTNNIGEKKVGSESDFAVYSFHATKCLTTGEGGALICNNNDMLSRVKALYLAYKHVLTFTDLQASLGLQQLYVYQNMLEKRGTIAAYYLSNIKPNLTEAQRNAGHSIYFRFLLRTNRDFNIVKKKFEMEEIAVRKGVDELLHHRYGIKGNYNNAEGIFQSTVSIPIYPALADSEMQKIVSVTNQLL